MRFRVAALASGACFVSALSFSARDWSYRSVFYVYIHIQLRINVRTNFCRRGQKTSSHSWWRGVGRRTWVQMGPQLLSPSPCSLFPATPHSHVRSLCIMSNCLRSRRSQRSRADKNKLTAANMFHLWACHVSCVLNEITRVVDQTLVTHFCHRGLLLLLLHLCLVHMSLGRRVRATSHLPCFTFTTSTHLHHPTNTIDSRAHT